MKCYTSIMSDGPDAVKNTSIKPLIIYVKPKHQTKICVKIMGLTREETKLFVLSDNLNVYF